MKPVQKILFGSPGTGKSFKIKNEIASKLGVDVSSENYIPTVFHPEYTYGDFMGKLMPLTVKEGNKNIVTYNYYEGHFLKALAQAYKHVLIFNLNQDTVIQDEEDEVDENSLKDSNLQNVLLVIDEINRGNSAAIFGTVFQLLDREMNNEKLTYNWSDYTITVSKLEFEKLIELIGLKIEETTTNKKTGEEVFKYSFNYKKTPRSKIPVKELKDWLFFLHIKENQIKIPSNLSIVATMNTSDNSIYFMDSAFKRRWDWEFVEIEDEKQKSLLHDVQIIMDSGDKFHWCTFIDRLNFFIKSNYEKIRKIEDKQVGYRFINEKNITEEKIKNKLMFFIWDSVFGNNKDPLTKLLFGEVNPESKKKLITFGDFSKNADLFVNKVMSNSF